MLTPKDIQQLVHEFSKVFATKHELENFATKEDLKSFATKADLLELKNEVLDRMDAVFLELKNMRQEQDFHLQKHRDIDERLDNIEEVPIITQSIKN